jgi:hypothetical protein
VELLQCDDDVLSAAAHTPFSRYLPTDQAWGGAIAARPIRVLAVISNPIDLHAKYGLPQAEVNLEEQTLREALRLTPGPSPENEPRVSGEGSGRSSQNRLFVRERELKVSEAHLPLSTHAPTTGG